jgi:hypothetical protein
MRHHRRDEAAIAPGKRSELPHLLLTFRSCFFSAFHRNLNYIPAKFSMGIKMHHHVERPHTSRKQFPRIATNLARVH